jgi:hypothetical protein
MVIIGFGQASVLLPAAAADRPERRDQGIQFSAPKSGVPSTDTGLSLEDRPRSFDFLQQGNSVSGVLEVPVKSGGGGTRRVASPQMLELLDQQRNWIYTIDHSSDAAFSPEKALGIRESDGWAGGGGVGAQGALADFMRQGRRSTPAPASALAGERPLSASSREAGRLDDLGLAGTTAGWGMDRTLLRGVGAAATDFRLGTAAPSVVAPLAGAPGSSLAPVEVGAMPFTSESLRPPSSIRQLLVSPDVINPLAEGFDPINLRVDATRQELNPTLPRRGPEIAAESKLKASSPLSEEGTAGLPRVSLLETLNLKSLANPSLSPVVTPPAPPPRSADRPVGFGEFPSRKF